ncbi:glycerophosphodiester phosphodiesterase family protein [Rhodohalobacter barkolensis]|uniref:Glycerophosphodiester phosphodiesterase n=1 Tax=Rhodohalobacter barkolensis TaxID=2053187 RepID=A0A2N0VM20_9BACT|nr:glycerophosphodiester phosphodiesterase family protein [Rhodohalobacter barkolensis]PKD45222.1 glycerophosphodiester phosphodiesterase [Rhodohalobacter barkolensis]
MRHLLVLFTALITISCTMEQSETFDLQGHRGARGLLPENTIPGFLKAVELGVNTVEFDVVVTGDGKLLVSHEPWFNHLFSTKPDGTPVTEEEAMSFNIFEMTYDETQQFDVGKRGNPNFPEQQPMEVTKPLMTDAIRAVEEFAKENNLPPLHYNIETKSRPEWYGEYVPGPDRFARMLYEELNDLDVLDRVIIQSFDPSTLIAFKQLEPNVRLAMLVSQNEPVDIYLNILGFTPDIWSPDYRLLNADNVQEFHSKGMKVIPWTVNSVDQMRSLMEIGVDGFITDYPDSAAVLF